MSLLEMSKLVHTMTVTMTTINPLLLLAVAVAAAGLGAGIAVFVIMSRKKNGQEQPFVVLDDREMDNFKRQDTRMSGTSDAGSLSAPIPQEAVSGSRGNFAFQDVELKSYQLTLRDLNSGNQYCVNVVDRITIGRKSSCIVCIPNKTLSGEHCEIVLNNGKMMLRDLNSTNGTFMNGSSNRIREAEVHTGDVIEIGSAKLQVQISVVSI